MRHRRMSLWFLVACLASLLVVSGASADTYKVTKKNDKRDPRPNNGKCEIKKKKNKKKCSLRAAIQTANANNGADKIVIKTKKVKLTRNGAGEDKAKKGDLDITSKITINGKGKNLTVKTGDRAFDVLSGGDLTVNRLNVKGGKPPSGESGGAYRSSGDLAIVGGSISNSNATGDGASGGGVFNDGGSLSISGAVLNNNSALRAGGGVEANAGSTAISQTLFQGNSTGPDVYAEGTGPGNGGGLHLTGAGTVDVSNSQFSANRAANEGGGLWNSATGTMTVTGTVIASNVATGPDSDSGGGGVYNDGTLTISGNTVIDQNDATGASGSGGGILNVGGSLDLSDSQVANGTASRAGGGIESNGGTIVMTGGSLVSNVTGPSPGNGGGLHITGAGNATITDVDVLSNSAAAEGGGLWNGSGTMTVTDSRISENTAAGNDADQGGGGLFNNGGTLEVDGDSVVELNTATGTSGSGGGILNDEGTLSVEDTTISGNSAVRAGGGIESDIGSNTIDRSRLENNTTGSSPGNGGGLHITGAGSLDIADSVVVGNTAAAEGGGLWNGSGTMNVTNTRVDGNTASGADANQGGGGLFQNPGGTLNVLGDSVVIDNVADGAAGSGGGILNDGGSLTVEDSKLATNTANRAGGGLESAVPSGGAADNTITDSVLVGNIAGPMGTANPGNGGGVHLSQTATLDITGSSVRGNYANREGGGLWNSTATMTVDSTTIRNNTGAGPAADDGGGGVFNNGGDLVVQNDTLIAGNSATGAAGSGGGLFTLGGDTDVTDSTIAGNDAVRAGGGIEGATAAAWTLDLTDTVLRGNSVGSSPGNGGGMHITDADGVAIVTVTGGAVFNNTAASEGGGLWNDKGAMTVSGVDIHDNEAEGADATNGGGGLFNNGGDLTVDGGTSLANNSATGAAGSGGGIFNDQGSLTVADSQLAGNSAVRAGGGIEDRSTDVSSTVDVDSTTFLQNSTGASPGNGGGIHSTDSPSDAGSSTLTVDDSAFIENDAANEGGGVWNGAGIFTVSNTSFQDNTSPTGPDAFNNAPAGVLTVNGSVVAPGAGL